MGKALGWRTRTSRRAMSVRAVWLLPPRVCGKAAATLLPLGLPWQIIRDCKTWSFLYKNASPNGWNKKR